MKINKGITLISLVITIIILLILSGISIQAIISKNGLFTRAKEVKEKANEAEVKEKVELFLSEYQMERINNDKLTLSDFFERESEVMEVIEDSENNEVKIVLNGYYITIDVKKGFITNIQKNEESESKTMVNLIKPITNQTTQGEGYNIFVSSEGSTYNTQSWFAVDGKNDTHWTPESGNYDKHYFMIKFSEARVVRKYELLGMDYREGTSGFLLQASKDGEDWNDLEDNVHVGSNSVQEYHVTLKNKRAYQYYRVYCPEVSGWTWGKSGWSFIWELKLYGY